jgi:hypothetical protein
VDVRLASPHELERPWRIATLVACAVAAVELVLLVGAAALLFGDDVARALERRAQEAAIAPATKPPAPAQAKAAAGPVAKLARGETSVMVLNGNGHSGAAASAATRLRGFGYVIAATGNATRQDYATSLVMYRPGYRGEAVRLARDLKLKVVGPLDGMPKSALMGGQLALVVGS